MTKRQVAKVEKFLRENVDEPFICSIRVQDNGVQTFAHALYDPAECSILYVGSMYAMFDMLNGSPEDKAAFKKLFIETLVDAAREL